MPRYEVTIRQLEDLPGQGLSFLAESPASRLQLSSIMQQAIVAWNQRQAEPGSVSLADYERLFELFNKGSITREDICEILNIDPASLTNLASDRSPEERGTFPSRYNREPVI